jgi:hypothetical protein
MPASIPIGTAAVNSELTQYLQDSWKAVIDADVDGPNAEAVKIDAGKPLFGQRSLTGVWRAPRSSARRRRSARHPEALRLSACSSGRQPRRRAGQLPFGSCSAR